MASIEDFTEEERKEDKKSIIHALEMGLYGQIKQREEINKEIRKTKRLIKKMEGY